MPELPADRVFLTEAHTDTPNQDVVGMPMPEVVSSDSELAKEEPPPHLSEEDHVQQEEYVVSPELIGPHVEPLAGATEERGRPLESEDLRTESSREDGQGREHMLADELQPLRTTVDGDRSMTEARRHVHRVTHKAREALFLEEGPLVEELTEMEARKKDCVTGGRFREAALFKQRVGHMRTDLAKRLQQHLQEQREREEAELGAREEESRQDFADMWRQRYEDIDAELQQEEDAMKARHAVEVDEFWRRTSAQPSRFHPSSEVVAQKKRTARLIQHERFEEADVVCRRMIATEGAEQKRFDDTRSTRHLRMEAVVLRRQAQEWQALQMRFKTKLHDMDVKREKHRVRLMRQFKSMYQALARYYGAQLPHVVKFAQSVGSVHITRHEASTRPVDEGGVRNAWISHPGIPITTLERDFRSSAPTFGEAEPVQYSRPPSAGTTGGGLQSVTGQGVFHSAHVTGATESLPVQVRPSSSTRRQPLYLKAREAAPRRAPAWIDSPPGSPGRPVAWTPDTPSSPLRPLERPLGIPRDTTGMPRDTRGEEASFGEGGPPPSPVLPHHPSPNEYASPPRAGTRPMSAALPRRVERAALPQRPISAMASRGERSPANIKLPSPAPHYGTSPQHDGFRPSKVKTMAFSRTVARPALTSSGVRV